MTIREEGPRLTLAYVAPPGPARFLQDLEGWPAGGRRGYRGWPAGDDARHAALQAGVTRFRPVLMTALAMIIGMVPMALGLGDGGEQNAPLGRAVIGGLGVATLTTLFFVPVMYSLLRRTAPKHKHVDDIV